MKANRLIIILFFLFVYTALHAQIGYQVAVMDQKKGEPKANASVAVSVTLTDNSGATICTESGTYTTDDFGIVSLQIGDASTFENTDWSKLPLWITAAVDGVTVSKTQVLSVPVAEYAKKTGSLTKELLCSKTWKESLSDAYSYETLSFHQNGSFTHHVAEFWGDGWHHGYISGTYDIIGNTVCLDYNPKDQSSGPGYVFVYSPKIGKLLSDDNQFK